MARIVAYSKNDNRVSGTYGESWPRWEGTYIRAGFNISVTDKKTYERAELVLDEDEVTDLINEIVRWKLGRELITDALKDHPQFVNQCMDTMSGIDLLRKALLPALYVAVDRYHHSMDMPIIPQRNQIVPALEQLLKILKPTEETTE